MEPSEFWDPLFAPSQKNGVWVALAEIPEDWNVICSWPLPRVHAAGPFSPRIGDHFLVPSGKQMKKTCEGRLSRWEDWSARNEIMGLVLPEATLDIDYRASTTQHGSASLVSYVSIYRLSSIHLSINQSIYLSYLSTVYLSIYLSI